MKDIRETFSRMSMNDEETVALIAGGHSFGKSHGAHPADECLGPVPASAPVELQGLGWVNSCGTGVGADTVTAGPEGAWVTNPIKWNPRDYLGMLDRFEWVKKKSPAGAIQWTPAGGRENVESMVPDAHDPDKRHAPMMFTTDLALKEDPVYVNIMASFRDKPEAGMDHEMGGWGRSPSSSRVSHECFSKRCVCV